jgi:transcriptional regulator with XRE-family HTH domain
LGDPGVVEAATELISPYVRRLRLAGELRALRAERGVTSAQIAQTTGLNRSTISRMENGHGFEQGDIIRLLDALGVEGDRWDQIFTIAREACERGWWESNKEMGRRQALYADLEAGAVAIREFQMIFLPGLLQTPEFTRSRVEAEGLGATTGRVADKSVQARVARQRMLRRPGGPTYDVIIDELAIRRRAASPEIVRTQLYQIASRVNGDPRTTVRVLPIDAVIDGYKLPRSAFSIYNYPDPGDPTVVTVDTVTDDLVLIDDADVKRYEALYERLRDATLPVTDSLNLLISATTSLSEP